ncbi:MAG: DUF58 domain-containing protein [Elainella sp.]
MKLHRLTTWLETRWVNPAYSGWLMAGLALFFFGAATNTMAGWLYAISGLMVALLVLAALLPARTLRGISLERLPVQPVTIGDNLRLELLVHNSSAQPKTLIQVVDLLPPPLPLIRTAIEQIPGRGCYRWTADLPTQQRGIYRWQQLHLRTAAPLGLFWRRRSQTWPTKAVVYPTVLNLSHCPLIDQIGQSENQQLSSFYQSQLASEGLTRTLRPYRWGDSTRMIHWRTSARYGDLRVRELETHQGGQELVIGLDSEITWQLDWFEQAVVAAASLYFYAVRQQRPVSLWTAASGLVKDEQAVLETLAAVQAAEHLNPEAARVQERLQANDASVILWLTQAPDRLAGLSDGSRWLLWPSTDSMPRSAPNSGILIQPDQPLQGQLQS